jgi:hypothetical protein
MGAVSTDQLLFDGSQTDQLLIDRLVFFFSKLTDQTN